MTHEGSSIRANGPHGLDQLSAMDEERVGATSQSILQIDQPLALPIPVRTYPYPYP